MDSDLSPYRECSLNTHCLRKELASLTSAWAGLDSVALVRLKLPTDLLVWPETGGQLHNDPSL